MGEREANEGLGHRLGGGFPRTCWVEGYNVLSNWVKILAALGIGILGVKGLCILGARAGQFDWVDGLGMMGKRQDIDSFRDGIIEKEQT